MWHWECLLCHLVTRQNLRAWHTITLLRLKATQTTLNFAQHPEFSFQRGFLICFYSQIPALAKPKPKSIEPMRLPPELPHRQRSQSLQTLCTKPAEEQESFFLPTAEEMCLSYTATFYGYKAGKG